MVKKAKDQNSAINIEGSVENEGDIVGRDKIRNISGNVVRGDGSTIINAENVSINDVNKKQITHAPNSGHCPICGKFNAPENTFKCKKCQRPLNCMGHMNKNLLLCSDCVNELEVILNNFHFSLEEAIENDNKYALHGTMTPKAISNFNKNTWRFLKQEFKIKKESPQGRFEFRVDVHRTTCNGCNILNFSYYSNVKIIMEVRFSELFSTQSDIYETYDQYETRTDWMSLLSSSSPNDPRDVHRKCKLDIIFINNQWLVDHIYNIAPCA